MVGYNNYHLIRKFSSPKMKQEQLSQIFKEYSKLKDNNEVPPLMQQKLDFLYGKIRGQNPASLPSLPEQQTSNLNQLTKQAGIQLFVSIVGCLSGRDIITFFQDEKAHIRKDQTFSIWSTCYLSCDTNTLIVKKKPDSKKPLHQFSLDHLRISKNYKQHKKKIIFGATYKKTDYFLIGFDIELVCVRTHKVLRQLIHDKSVQMVRQSNPQQIKRIDKTEKIKKQVQKPQQPQIFSYNTSGDAVDEQMIEYLKDYELVTEDMYLLKKNDGNYRKFIHKNYPNKFKQVIFLDSAERKESWMIFSLYMKMNQWNPEIESVKILKKLSDNGYLVQLRVKSFNLMAWARSVIVVIKAVSYRDNSYLIIRSIEEQPEYTDTVQMEWNQLIEVCETEDKTKFLLTIVSEFDFKGYCSFQYSQEMGFKVMENIRLFENVVNSSGVCGKVLPLFQLLPQKRSQGIKKSEDNKIEEEQSSNSSSQYKRQLQDSEFEISNVSGSQSGSSVDGQSFHQEKIQFGNNQSINEPLDFIIYMMKSDENTQISLKLIDLLKQKVNEKYYLKHKFDQKPHTDLSRNLHSIEEPNHYFHQNESWILNEKGQALFVNEQIIQMQKQTFKRVIKQISSHVMSGKSIMNMSLPCELFEPRSVLERIAMGFGYAPTFLVQGAKAMTPLQQMKYVASFIMGSGVLHTNTRKPFNPILGETFECIIGGIPFYMEQISHHPPISSFYMETQDFKTYGNFNSHVEMGLNQVTGNNLSPIFVEFKKLKTFYEIKLSSFEVNGLMYGDKKYRPSGVCFIHERSSNIFAQINMGKDKKKVYEAEQEIDSNKYYGGIYKVTEAFAKKFKQCENKRKFQGLKPNDFTEKYMKVSGFWNQTFFIGDQQMKSMNKPLPNKIQYPQYILPSDSNFRQDIIYKRLGDLKLSNHCKQILENIQRNDRKLRQGQKKKK